VILAVVLAALVLRTAIENGVNLNAVSLALLALQTLPVAVRRRNPLRIMGVTGIATTLYYTLGFPDSGGQLGILLAFFIFYTVAANEPRRRAMARCRGDVHWHPPQSHGLRGLQFAYRLGNESGHDIRPLRCRVAVGDNLRVRRAYTKNSRTGHGI